MASQVVTYSDTTAANATSVAAALPTGTADDDMLIASVTCSAISETLTPPAGWAYLGGQTSAGTPNSDMTTWYMWKLASGEASTWTFTISSSAQIRANVIAVRNTTGAVATSGLISGNTSPHTGPSGLSLSVRGIVLYMVGLNASAAGSPGYTNPTNGRNLSRVYYVGNGATVGGRYLGQLCVADARLAGTIPAYNAVYSESQEFVGLTVGLLDGPTDALELHRSRGTVPVYPDERLKSLPGISVGFGT